MLVTVTNRHTAELAISASFGILAGGAQRTVDLTTAEMDDSKDQLIALTNAGLIDWSVAPTTDTGDDDLEYVSRADLAAGVSTVSVTASGGISASAAAGVTVGTLKILSGTAAPEGAVTAPAGSIYARDNGTVYVKATGAGNTGWAAIATV